ncbi:MAG: serine/threonine protein kinase, partial [Vicinamibacteria bacterium]|nr:serine/threonine protein kinase [Vicinamibacteria bacterium]
GTRLGPYEILGNIGQGGMSIVYQALDTGLNRHVAIKVLSSEFLSDPSFGGRFRSEAQIWARLEHPAIVPVYTAAIEQDLPFIVMRFMEGGSLHARLREGRLTWDATLAILSDVARALDFAHSQGVIHRDVKPANVLLDDGGHAYLSDFGIARVMSGSGVRTIEIVGTPAYMAPEQARSQAPSPLVDIYSMGCMAYEMLTGVAPFAGSPLDVMMRHVSESPMPPSRLAPELVAHVDTAILKSLDKDPRQRWPSASLFIRALNGQIDVDGVFTVSLSSTAERHPTPAPLTPAAPSDGPFLSRNTYRNRAPWIATLALVVTLAAAGWFFVSSRSPLRAPEPTPTPAPAPVVYVSTINKYLDEGAYNEAAELADIAARIHPNDVTLARLRERIKRAWEAEKQMGLWPDSTAGIEETDNRPTN